MGALRGAVVQHVDDVFSYHISVTIKKTPAGMSKAMMLRTALLPDTAFQ